MKKGLRNALTGAGLAAAGVGLVAAVSYATSKILVGAAMNREEPPLMKKNKGRISGLSDFEELFERMDQAALQLAEKEHERVEMQSHDGLCLVGHWYMPQNPKRVVIAMHGWRSTWAKDFGLVADFWFENDCAVLFAEQRGQGESQGEYITFGLMERLDCLAWANWVTEATGGLLPIYLAGLSMGATTVLMAGGLDLPESVKGILADCAFTSPDAIWKHVASKNMKIPYGKIHALFADGFTKKKIAVGSREHSTVRALADCKVPVLFVHGTDDHFVPVEMTFENYKACAAEKRLFVVPGADHGMSYLVNQPDY